MGSKLGYWSGFNSSWPGKCLPYSCALGSLLSWCLLLHSGVLTLQLDTSKILDRYVKSAYKPSGPSSRSLSLVVYVAWTDGMLVHCRDTSCIKFARNHLYNRAKRGSVRVKCLAQECNTMSPARAGIPTARSGVKCTNCEATVPPHSLSGQQDSLTNNEEEEMGETWGRTYSHTSHQLHINVFTLSSDWSTVVYALCGCSSIINC